MQTCFEYNEGSFPVKLEQYANGKFRVTYGQEVNDCLPYWEAARKLGNALMHCAACDGKLTLED